jgi:hypothetical protein
MRLPYAERGGNPNPGNGENGHSLQTVEITGPGDWERWGHKPEVWPFDVGPEVWDAVPGICRLHIVLSKNGANAVEAT